MMKKIFTASLAMLMALAAAADTPSTGATPAATSTGGDDELSWDAPAFDDDDDNDAAASSSGAADDADLSRYCSYGNERVKLSAGGIYFGFLNATHAPATMGVEMAKSFQTGIDNLLSLSVTTGRVGHFDVGFGLDWKIYAMTGSQWRFMASESGVLGTAPWPEGVVPRKSRLNTFSMQFPITYTFNLPVRLWGANMDVTLGPVLMWNTYSALTSSWTQPDGVHQSVHQANLHQRRFTVDLYAKVRVGSCVGFFVRYSPMTSFKKGMGPNFQPLSVGFVLF